MNTDRTQIAPLLLKHFPTMEKATSDEWHGFLNAQTGLNVPLYESNGVAFDAWRKALAQQLDDEEIWPYTPSRIAKMEADAQQLLAAEQARVEAQPQKLALLASFAPKKSPADLIKDTWRAFKI